MKTNSAPQEFFVAGGTLWREAPSYISRPADDELFRLVSAGEYSNVLAARQMGKSSLMVQTANRLRESGVRTSILDISTLGGGISTPDAWFFGFLDELVELSRGQIAVHVPHEIQLFLGEVKANRRRTRGGGAAGLALSRRHGARMLVAPVDLMLPDAIPTIRSLLVAERVRIRLLVNNAACGRWGRFEDTPPEAYHGMIQLNVSAVVAFCHHFLPDLISFPTSAIINVSSAACFQPVPYMAVYAATKSFLHNFSQALHGEWKNRGVLVQTLVPGPTSTEFDAKAGAYESAIKERGLPETVVSASLFHLAKNAPLVVTAKGTYPQRIFAGLFPAKWVIRQVEKMFRPPIDRVSHKGRTVGS
jgi:hypothetical protein